MRQRLLKRLQQSFDLIALFPSAEAMAAGVKEGLHLACARDDLRPIKDTWTRIAAGQTDRLAQCDSRRPTLPARLQRTGLPGAAEPAVRRDTNPARARQ